MKNLLHILAIILFSVILVSCLNDDDYYIDPIENISQVKIDSVKIPSLTMKVFTSQPITCYTTLKNLCEGFYGYNYQKAGNMRNIVEYSYLRTGVTCGSTTYVSADSFNFQPENVGTYTFNFATKSITGEDSLIVKEIVVTE